MAELRLEGAARRPRVRATGKPVNLAGAAERVADRPLGQDQLKLGARPVKGLEAGYHTVESSLADLQALAAKFPDKAQLVDLGPSYDTTQDPKADRHIWALKIGTGDTSTKPAVLVVGGIHAREIAPPEQVHAGAHWMLESGDADAAAAVANNETWLVPIGNPDGHLKVEQGNDMWRKNDDLTAGGDGVDINRNFPSPDWGDPKGSSNDPSADDYHGKAALSEPETRALDTLMGSVAKARGWVPGKPPIGFWLDVHAYGNDVMWPLNYTKKPPSDPKLPAIGKKLGELSHLKAFQGVGMYPTAGDTTDDAFLNHGLYAFTAELGTDADGFAPPYSRVPEMWQQNVLPMLRYLQQTAGNPGADLAAHPNERAVARPANHAAASQLV